jgi:hypothetical protein
MAQSLLLPAAVALAGAVVTLFFARPQPVSGWGEPASGMPGSAAGRQAGIQRRQR